MSPDGKIVHYLVSNGHVEFRVKVVLTACGMLVFSCVCVFSEWIHNADVQLWFSCVCVWDAMCLCTPRLEFTSDHRSRPCDLKKGYLYILRFELLSFIFSKKNFLYFWFSHSSAYITSSHFHSILSPNNPFLVSFINTWQAAGGCGGLYTELCLCQKACEGCLLKERSETHPIMKTAPDQIIRRHGTPTFEIKHWPITWCASLVCICYSLLCRESWM